MDTNEQQAKDAARYRWWRSFAGKTHLEQDVAISAMEESESPEMMDSVVDAAMQAKGE